MKTHLKIAAAVLASSTLLMACSSPQQPVASQPYPQTYPNTTPAYSTSYGVVDSIQVINAQTTSNGGIGLGAVTGGVVGGVLGNQVGSGTGRRAATAAGAIGGAVVGHQIQQRNRANQAQPQAYQIGVRLDNGSYQTVTQDSVADISVGNRVRIENGRAYRY
ncbi:MAG: glycine zipper 2TM domain-containing protein [Burkholderiaceae bacterium]